MSQPSLLAKSSRPVRDLKKKSKQTVPGEGQPRLCSKHVYKHVHTNACALMHTCIHRCLYACVCVCMHAHVHTHTYSHTQNKAPSPMGMLRQLSNQAFRKAVLTPPRTTSLRMEPSTERCSINILSRSTNWICSTLGS